jgi:hypothetical protein
MSEVVDTILLSDFERLSLKIMQQQNLIDSRKDKKNCCFEKIISCCCCCLTFSDSRS